MRALWLPAQLRAFGLKVEVVPGWETRGNAVFDPAGVLAHHTASAPGKNAPSLNVVIAGRSDLPGPLCHVLLARDATCYVVASGRANHAGAGNWQGLTSNRELFGIEAENDGRGEHWSSGQLDAFQRCAAALLAHLGRGAQWCAGHKEYALPKGRKIDPTLDMPQFRAGVAYLLAHPPDVGDGDLTPEEHTMLKEALEGVNGLRSGKGFTDLSWLDAKLKAREDSIVARVVEALRKP